MSRLYRLALRTDLKIYRSTLVNKRSHSSTFHCHPKVQIYFGHLHCVGTVSCSTPRHSSSNMSSGFPSLAHSSQPFPLPSIAEDTLDYTLHLPPSQGQEQQDSSALALLISEYVQSLLIQPWLWNKDSWELKVISKTGDNAAEGGRLGGRMRVGDAVDDEWLVVHLLRQVSQRWPELVIG